MPKDAPHARNTAMGASYVLAPANEHVGKRMSSFLHTEFEEEMLGSVGSIHRTSAPSASQVDSDARMAQTKACERCSCAMEWTRAHSARYASYLQYRGRIPSREAQAAHISDRIFSVLDTYGRRTALCDGDSNPAKVSQQACTAKTVCSSNQVDVPIGDSSVNGTGCR